jgi:pyruvate/2-oxoglutarate dehydrogenase complex dihydrolipoamide dehydrogenase (E3) component
MYATGLEKFGDLDNPVIKQLREPAPKVARAGAMAGPQAIDMNAVRRRKRAMVERQVANHLQKYKASGAELIMGSGRFVSPKTLEVELNDGGKRVLAADKIVLNIGTHATVPNVPGLDRAL